MMVFFRKRLRKILIWQTSAVCKSNLNGINKLSTIVKLKLSTKLKRNLINDKIAVII